jgi:hypothetical protein
MPPNQVRRPRPDQETRPAEGLATETHSTTDGLERAIAKASADWWAQNALLAIQQLARSNRAFTAEHVLDMVGAPTDPHYVGAVFAIAQRKRIAEAVGATIGPDARLLRVWWGVPS